MAIVVRYFSTTAAGAGDGTTWADRAALFSSGNWSSVITGFAFNGSDSLECRIGPGTYTCSQSLASGTFTTAAPAAANPLILHGADSSGNRVAIDLEWTAARPAGTSFDFAEIQNATTGASVNVANCFQRGLVFSASANNTSGVINTSAGIDWCHLKHSHSGTGVFGTSTNTVRITNSIITMSGTSYDSGLQLGNATIVDNVRVEGNSSASAGNRRGVTMSGTTAERAASRVLCLDHVGGGFVEASTNTGQRLVLSRCMAIDCAGDGFLLASTASQTNWTFIDGCVATGCGDWGLDAQSGARVFLRNSRFRDNTSGNVTGLGNYPADLDVYTTDADDAADYVDAAGGDYRIKSTAGFADRNIGIEQQAAAGGGGVYCG